MADGGIGAPSMRPLRLGDPVPWFSASTVTGGRVDLHVDAGRWILLVFPGPLDRPASRENLQQVLGLRHLFSEDYLVCHVILPAPPPESDLGFLSSLVGPALNFLIDLDGTIGACYGVDEPRSFLLDNLLRAVANLRHSEAGHGAALEQVLTGLPPVDQSVGVTLSAPILIIPRVFEFELCDVLVSLFDDGEGEESGFLFDQDGMTRTVLNPALKRRRDIVIGNRELAGLMQDRVATRVVPAIRRFFNYEVSRMDRRLVSCYDSLTGGHFFRHRDNENAGAAHRRFAMTIGLNKEFTGGELRFPEFGRQSYAAPVGGAIVFSCGMLHEVLPVLSGKRFVFVPFLYGEAEAQLRIANNRFLAAGEARYTGDDDRLPI